MTVGRQAGRHDETTNNGQSVAAIVGVHRLAMDGDGNACVRAKPGRVVGRGREMVCGVGVLMVVKQGDAQC